MARIMYKKVKRRRPRNTLHAQALKDGVLRPKVIGDKRHKFLENQAKGVYYNVYCKKSNEVIDSFINLEYDNEGNYKIFKELKDA